MRPVPPTEEKIQRLYFLKFRPIWPQATESPLCVVPVQGLMQHVRIGKDIRIADAVTFLAGDRSHVEEAVSGDIIGLHNHGTIQIGDTFTEGEVLRFTGIPHFAPELFKRVRLKDPLKMKQLRKATCPRKPSCLCLFA